MSEQEYLDLINSSPFSSLRHRHGRGSSPAPLSSDPININKTTSSESPSSSSVSECTSSTTTSSANTTWCRIPKSSSYPGQMDSDSNITHISSTNIKGIGDGDGESEKSGSKNEETNNSSDSKNNIMYMTLEQSRDGSPDVSSDLSIQEDYIEKFDEDDELTRFPLGNSKAFEMTILNGEKSHLLIDEKKISVKCDIEHKIPQAETFWSISLQVFFPFLVAGMGMVGAGIVLDVVQHWPVFVEIPEVFILVPALLGLKGNLEMTLASRLSTQANLGNLDSSKAQWNMSVGNLSLVQCQSILVGFLASIAAVIFGWIPDGHFDINHALLLCTSSVLTASIASFALGVVMVLVIIFSRQFKINPDNVATPIAASLGDLTTLTLLACISNSIYSTLERHHWVSPVILGIYCASMPFWIYLAKQNKLTEQVLYTGWTPVLSAMMISSLGGLILDFAVKNFTGVAVFQPVINGVGGNLVAVQASRISTSLHFESQLGTLPPGYRQICTSPLSTFISSQPRAVTARALLMMTIPGHLIFAYTISYIQAGHTSITPVFLVFYLLAAVIQVVLLLFIAEVLIKYLWANKIDPDNSAIPYLTALGDLIGTALLAMAFFLLYLIGDRDGDVGD